MAKIVDPDQLNQAAEVVIATGAKTIQLLVAGNLDDTSPGATSGASGQAVYSFLKEEWKSDAALNKFKFPLKSFTKNEFQWINGWSPADLQTRDLFRDAGWSETVATEDGDLYGGFISLGNFDAVGDQGYYAQVAGLSQTTIAFDKTGNVNEPVLIDDASGTDFTGYFKAFLREQGKLYDSYDLLAEQGFAALEATIYRFPLSNSTDLNITKTDAYIDAVVAVTFTNATNLVNATAHPFANNDKIQFELSGGTLPAELALVTTYYIINANANDFQVALTLGGAAVTFTDDGTTVVNAVSWPHNDMTIAYISGTGFTTWANSTVYAAEAVVYDGINLRWWFTDLGGTSSGTGTDDDTGVTDWVAFEGERLIGSLYYAFNVIIDAPTALATRNEGYHFTQRELRQTTDINTGTITDANQDTIGVVNGNIADELSAYRGSDVVFERGVFFDNYAASEINNIIFVPIPVDAGAEVEVTFPFVTVVTLNLPANVVAEVDADTRGTNYFTNNDTGDDDGSDFDTANAIPVKDNTAEITVTFTNATNLINATGHGMPDTTRIMFENSGGAIPAELNLEQVYFVVSTLANSFQVALTEGGSAVTFTDDGTGTSVVVAPVDFDGADIAANAYVFNFDYDNNVQRGAGSGGTDAPCSLQMVGLAGFEIGVTTFNITRVANLAINVVANDERNYSNV